MASGALGERAVRRFSADEVLRMLAAGILGEGEPLELLDGELVVVTPQGPAHSSLTVRIRRRLERAYGPGFHVRDHSPVAGPPDSLPEPDLAVVHGEPEAFSAAFPTAEDVLLVVEVAVTSGAIDRRKASIYARAGYAAYWIVHVEARRLEVHHTPTADGDYASVELLDVTAQCPLPGGEDVVAVADLLL